MSRIKTKQEFIDERGGNWRGSFGVYSFTEKMDVLLGESKDKVVEFKKSHQSICFASAMFTDKPLPAVQKGDNKKVSEEELVRSEWQPVFIPQPSFYVPHPYEWAQSSAYESKFKVESEFDFIFPDSD